MHKCMFHPETKWPSTKIWRIITTSLYITGWDQPDGTEKLKMSDSSSIHTVEEISHHDFASSQDAATSRSISESEATEEITPRNSYETNSWETASNSYETNSWETASNSSIRSSFGDSRRTLESISDDDDYSGRKRRWRRSDGAERTTSLETSSYYSTRWDSSGSRTVSKTLMVQNLYRSIVQVKTRV